MTSKPETIIKQIEELPPIYSKMILKFKDWLIDEEDSSFANAGNYLRVLNLFCKDLGNKELKDVTKEMLS